MEVLVRITEFSGQTLDRRESPRFDLHPIPSHFRQVLQLMQYEVNRHRPGKKLGQLRHA